MLHNAPGGEDDMIPIALEERTPLAIVTRYNITVRSATMSSD